MDKLEKALKIFGDEYVNAMADILKKADKIASGDLIKSLKTRIFKTAFGTSYTLKVISAIHMKYVESGRRAGAKPPPVAPIKKWIKDKRLGLPEGAAYGIAKNIGKNGIKPVDVIDQAFKDARSSVSTKRLETATAEWVGDIITDRLKGLSKNKNITFK